MEKQSVQRVLQGRVVSDKMDKSAVVLVERRVKHKLYPKVITLSQKYNIHDPENTCGTGDLVKISEGKPISKNKSWHFVEVIEKAK